MNEHPKILNKNIILIRIINYLIKHSSSLSCMKDRRMNGPIN